MEKKCSEAEREKKQSDYMRQSQDGKKSRLKQNNKIMAEINTLPHDEKISLEVAAARIVSDEFEKGSQAYNVNFRTKLFELYQNKYG